MTSNKEIIRFLTAKSLNGGFVDKLKIRYRPIICPFPPLLEITKGKSSAFDIGCGSGQFCALLDKFTSLKKIKGIEINERLINNANQVNKEAVESGKCTFAVFDGKTIPDDIKDYDLVYMIDVFHHIPPDQQKAFMQQLAGKMKSGATLVFKDINAASPLVIFNKLHDMVFAGEIGKEMSYKNAKALLTEVGFEITDSFLKTVAVYPHYYIFAKKK